MTNKKLEPTTPPDDWDFPALQAILRNELEPFIIGAGKIACRDIDEGLIVVRIDDD